MAKIIAGIGLSHSPSIVSSYDPALPFYVELTKVKHWLTDLRPDAVIVVSSEHLNGLTFDLTPTFLLGVAEHYDAAAENDQTERQRQMRPTMVKGHAALAWQLANALVAGGFDMSISQTLRLDHGMLNPLVFLFESEAIPPIVPLLVNAFQPPLPTPARCWALGLALKSAIEAIPDDLRVVVVGAGGLSHHLLGQHVGFTNEAWDRRYMELLQSHPHRLAELTTQQMVERGGQASTENVNWLAMRASLGERASVRFTDYFRPSFTGLGLLAFDNP